MARQFELKMMDHLRQKFPSETEKKEDDELLAEIRQGVRTSGKYGISAEYDVARYMEYMMMYGLSFDTDPKWDWAGKILKTEGISGADSWSASIRATSSCESPLRTVRQRQKISEGRGGGLFGRRPLGRR